MSYNKITIIGNLGKDPELRYTPQGTPVCNFSVATTEKWRGGDGQMQERTLWFKVTVWGKQGESCSKYLAKGRPVYVEGRLRFEEWQGRDGKPGYTHEVNATEVQFLGDGSSGGGRDEGGHHDQRRRGPDENERSQDDDALSLDDKSDDDIPF